MDVLEKLVQSLRPDLDLSQTLARLAADLTPPNPAQPIAPITNPVQTPTKAPDAPPSSSQPISRPPHEGDPTENPTGEIEETGGEGSVRGMAAEVEPEMMVGEAGMAGEEVEGEEVYSGATKVLSEGETEVIKEGEEKGDAKKLDEEEEVVQPVANKEQEIQQAVGTRDEVIEPAVGHREAEMEQDFGHKEVEMEHDLGKREEVILVTDDEEVIEKEQPMGVAGQRTGDHRYSPVGQLEEVLATSGWMAVRSIGSDDEEEEGESTLIRRPRSNRRPLTEKTAGPEGRQTAETTPQAEKTAAQGERQEEVSAGEAETEEERLRRERKRKGKEIAKPVKKKMKQASRNVVIQEPVRATHGVTAGEESDEEEKELRWERLTKKR